MAAGEIHVNDVGTQFQLTFLDQNSNIVDISSATIKQITFRDADLITFTKNMGFLTNGTDGIATYTTASGDIDTPGIWQFQGYVSMPSGNWYTDIITFPVF